LTGIFAADTLSKRAPAMGWKRSDADHQCVRAKREFVFS